ncbi:MAG: hypothetical protein KBS81_07800 [Spirochaetales bacterium]|nr:hypothetical protein [Candidatus Physcosoma equi]
MMKRFLPLLLFCLLLLASCNGEIGYNYLFVNETADMNVFPYLVFTLNDTNSGVYADVVEGARVKNINVPNYVHTDYGTLPVIFFNGFQNPEDAENLEIVHLPETLLGIKEDAFSKADDLKEIYLPVALKPQIKDYGLDKDKTDIYYLGLVEKPGGSWGVGVVEEENLPSDGGFIEFGYLMTSFGQGHFMIQKVGSGWAMAYVEPPRGYRFVWTIDGVVEETAGLRSFIDIGNPQRASCMVYDQYGNFLAWAEISR